MLRGVGEAPLCAFVFGMIGDVVEFGQWKHHIRQESFIFAGGSVGTKLGTGIAQASIAGLMSLCGYISSTGSAVVQSQSAINSIINIYMFGPLLIFVGVLIVGLLYQLDKKYPAIMKELAEREARGAHYLLEVDGGVDAATAPQCVAAGADVLVAGSAIYGAADPAAAVRALAAL